MLNHQDRVGDPELGHQMIKKRLGFLLLSALAPVLVIASLYKISELAKSKPNGFIRLEPPHILQPGDTKDLGFNSFYIAGLSKDSIYLGNHSTPFSLLVVAYNLKTSAIRPVNWGNGIKVAKGALLSVDSGNVFLNDGLTGQRISLDLDDKGDRQVVKTFPYLASVQIGRTGMIYRSIDKQENVLIKQAGDIRSAIIDSSLLIKQGDGIFSTDGLLFSSRAQNKIVYIYYYRNQFLCIDTNLKRIYTGKTIDTISRAHIKLAHVKSDKATTMSAPPLKVNKSACASDQYIFINSALTANNEPHEVLNAVEIIDVYNLKDGKYKLSFYLPNLTGKRVSDFKVYGNKLVAIYGKYLTVYTLKFWRTNKN